MISKTFDHFIIMILIVLVFLSEILVSSSVSLISGLLILILIFIKSLKISLKELSLVLPLLLMLLIGLIGSLFHLKYRPENFGYMVAKDSWYYIKPVVYLLAGLYVYREGIKKEAIIRVVIYMSLIISIQHLVRFITFLIISPPEEIVLDIIRTQTSFVSLIQAFSLAYLLVYNNKSLVTGNLFVPRWLILSVLITSVLVSVSRTLFITFIVSLLAFNRFFSFRFETALKSGFKIIVLALLIIFSLILLNRFSSNGSILHAFTEKYLNSVKENTYLKTYSSNSVINRNWRGYETHIAKKEISNAALPEKVFGFGFGKTVFIGTEGFLGEGLTNIPKLHNGFIEIILKTGFSGLLLYLIFFFYIFRLADSKNSCDETELFLKAIIVSSFLSTFVITGLYNKSALDPACFLLGYFSGIILHNPNAKY